MTISMLGLAGIPATAGFIGKFYLIDAAVSGGYTWLGVVIVIGSMISLGYYLPVIAAMWMRPAPEALAPDSPPPLLRQRPALRPGLPALAGGSPELDRTPAPRRERGHGRRPGTAAAPDTGPQPEVVLVAVLAGAVTLFFGIIPQPLFDLVTTGAARSSGCSELDQRTCSSPARRVSHSHVKRSKYNPQAHERRSVPLACAPWSRTADSPSGAARRLRGECSRPGATWRTLDRDKLQRWDHRPHHGRDACSLVWQHARPSWDSGFP